MQKLEPPDSHHFNAAVGWLELGNPTEAHAELDRISLPFLLHPEVLDLRWRIQAKQGNWTSALDLARKLLEVEPDDPAGWINQSFTLHELKRTQEAWDALLPAASRFPDVAIIQYNLACYACQLGKPDLAKDLFQRALKLGSKDELKGMALNDSDLAPIRDFIATLPA